MTKDVELYGVKDGKEVFLGVIKQPPDMKAREIMRDYGYTSYDDDMSEDALILGMLEDLASYCRDYYHPFKPN